MKRFLAIPVGAFLVFTFLAVSAHAQTWITDPKTNHQYKLIQCGDWFTCKDMASSQGGHLVTISDEDENIFIFDNLVHEFYEDSWIGYSDQKTEGSWAWITGEKVNYINWSSEEPSPPSNDYSYMASCYSGRWSSAAGTESWIKYAVIEKDPPSNVIGTWSGTMKISRSDGTFLKGTGITVKILKQNASILSGTMQFEGKEVSFSGLQKGKTLNITAEGLSGVWSVNADYTKMTLIRMHDTAGGSTMEGSATRQ